MELIRRLEEIGRDDVATAGGKGANLGELIRAGLAVPPGFVVLTSAYQFFVEQNNIQKEIERLVGQVSLSDLSSIEQGAVAMRMLFDKGNMPGEIVSAVRTAYAHMGGGAVAVRSSATTEDLPNDSFAGQQETYLHIQAEDEMLTALQHCWSSLWTPRALDYRTRQGIDPGSVSIAVVVQEMVPASTAGILFTNNPVTDARDEIVINAAWGLGEAIVTGQVTPDMLVINKQTGKVKRIEIGNKSVMTVPAQHGTTKQVVNPTMRQAAVLSPEQIAELTLLGCKIEEHFGTAQDIEWAITDGHIFVLQSRPITTTPKAQEAPPGDDTWDREGDLPAQPFDLWTRTNAGENLPFPVTPLTETQFPRLFALDTTQAQQGPPSFQAVRRLYGRLYMNEGAILHELTEKYGLPASLIDKAWGSRPRGNQAARRAFRPLRLIRNLPSLLRQGMSTTKQKGPKHTPEQFFAQIDQWVNASLQEDLSLLDDRALWQQGLPLWRERGAYAFSTNLRISTPSAFLYAALERLVKWWTGRKGAAQDLVTGLPGMFSAEIGPAIWCMAQTLREQGLSNILLDNSPMAALILLQNTPEAETFNKQLASFLVRHGHRCPNELEVLNPRWEEAPEQILELVASYLRAGENVNPIEAEKRQQQRRSETLASIEANLDSVRRTIFRAVLKRTQLAMTIRDNSRYYMTKFAFPVRKVYSELGRRWAERGWLQRSDDIFFLLVTEIEAIAENGDLPIPREELHTRVANRRIAYEYWLTVVAPDAIGPDGKPIIEDTQDSNMLEGVPASSGNARGRARIVLDVREAMHLSSGDILVTQATDPGWTPVFPLVSGIVLEIGGQLSHGAILAREYGIPAVVNVQGAMHTIQDGQTITVDGTNGRIYLDEHVLV